MTADLTGLRNRKFHEILAETASQTTPTPSWGAALARALQGGVAGLIERGDEAQSREALPALLQILQGGGAVPPQVSSAPQAPSMAPRPASGGIAAALSRPPAQPGADEITQAKTPQDYINRAYGGLTPQGRDVATRTVLGEAADQGPVGMAGVADVMRNRAVSGGYGGNTMDQVALAKNQFEPWNTAKGRAKMQSYSPMSPAYGKAQEAVDSASIGTRPDVTGGASYFYAPKLQAALAPTDGRPVVPPFAQGQPSAVIGDHNFYRERGQPAPPAQQAPLAEALQPPQQQAQVAPQAQIAQAPDMPQTGSKGSFNDEQMAQLRAMANHPNKNIRDYASGLISKAVADRFKPAEYDIKTENGVTIAVNKNKPSERVVVNDPVVAAALIKNKADETYATKSAEKRAEKDIAEPDRRKNELTAGNIVVQDIDRSLSGMDKAKIPTTGLIGMAASHVPGTASSDVKNLIDTIKANTGFQQLAQMRQASPTGGALGAITVPELEMLQAAVGNLSQKQSEVQLKDNLKRVKNLYLDIIHGKGNGRRETPSFEGKGASGQTSSGVSWSVN